MNLGMLKLYKIFTIIAIIVLSTGCSVYPEKQKVKQIVKQKPQDNKLKIVNSAKIKSDIVKKQVSVDSKKKIEEIVFKKTTRDFRSKAVFRVI